MPTTKFTHRLVFDTAFFEDFKERKFTGKPSILIKLMKINDQSASHKRTHNVMSKKTFTLIITNNPSFERSILRASFYDLENPDIEGITEETERTIKLAIDLLEDDPNRSVIITSDSKKAEYENNPHFKGVKEISVRAGKEAETLIDSFFNECKRQ